VTATLADQALMPLTVTTGGVPAAYNTFDVLPAATTAADLAVRASLRSCGALRPVMAATSAADFTAAALALGGVASTREAEKKAGHPAAGKPVVQGPGGDVPVVANY
jgi:hypothetical protein